MRNITVRSITVLSPAENVPADALPKATAYLKTLKPAKLKRLYHHLSFGRLVMMHSCDCLLGFEGDYSTERRNPIAAQAESELFNYPVDQAPETDENNQIRSRTLMTIINRILAQKASKKSPKSGGVGPVIISRSPWFGDAGDIKKSASVVKTTGNAHAIASSAMLTMRANER